MKLIIGGAFQGKTDYAMKKYYLLPGDIRDGSRLDITEICGIKCISRFHVFIKRLIEAGKDPVITAEKITEKNPEIVFIMNEVGSGIVPMEKSERIWREQVGKTGCYLAKKADEVVRITCGCAVILKGQYI